MEKSKERNTRKMDGHSNKARQSSRVFRNWVTFALAVSLRLGHKNQYVWRERGVPVAAAQLFPIIGHEGDYQFGLANHRSGSQSKRRPRK